MTVETQEPSAPIDNYDLNRLMHAILKQAMDDYVKLQHPIARRKKYMQEAFDSAVDMFFDSDFSFMYVKDEENKEIGLKELVYQLMSDDRVDVDKIKKHVVTDAQTFWQNKFVNTIDIPESLIYNGHVYSVLHIDDNDDAAVDFDQKIILLNKSTDCSDNQELFMQLCLQVVAYHEEFKIPAATMNKLGNSLFRLLRMNSCFVGG
jgi:hypothetical protein